MYGEPATPAWQEGWTVTEQLVRELHAAVRSSGATFGVLVVPSIFEVQASAGLLDLEYPELRGRTWDFDYPARRLGALCEREGIPWLALLPALRAAHADTGELSYYTGDGHWNETGHAVVAHTARPFIELLLAERRRIPSRPTSSRSSTPRAPSC